ncbi:cytochrome b/b6 domain-containing protein [Vibrio tapetis subsp. quintayensis]|uniref:cytochrome b/b6 domain-containing protein n=1 Tax=Vibrio tapetis TaxID=52443 RepID=UPI0025B3CA5A|nr:cytochrome b/b6 domain-containing protein [Vibrio tapetis]MDN3682966.1 cytochrome b/b6 domain-containing protein [Vibrio tapetis subsp. quintayensis]
MKVWDLATRLYHWTQAAVFVGLMISGQSGNGPHVQLGLILLTLVIWRVCWGFIGSETSRFSQFVRSPKIIWHYLTGQLDKQAGHNPLGALMVVSLISSLLLQCLSGLALAGLLDQLPMAEIWLTDAVFSALESIHYFLADALSVLVFVHVLVILIYKLAKKPLVWAMITGYQTKPSTSAGPILASNLRALLVLITAGLGTMTIIALSMV